LQAAIFAKRNAFSRSSALPFDPVNYLDRSMGLVRAMLPNREIVPAGQVGSS